MVLDQLLKQNGILLTQQKVSKLLINNNTKSEAFASLLCRYLFLAYLSANTSE